MSEVVGYGAEFAGGTLGGWKVVAAVPPPYLLPTRRLLGGCARWSLSGCVGDCGQEPVTGVIAVWRGEDGRPVSAGSGRRRRARRIAEAGAYDRDACEACDGGPRRTTEAYEADAGGV